MLYLLLTLLLFSLILTIINTISLPKITQKNLSSDVSYPTVNLYIPLRNEERHVESLIENLKKLTYPNLSIYLLDDGSTDNTHALLKTFIRTDSRFTLLQGIELPKEWVGKVHACHQLSKHGDGEFALFMDADVTIAPSTIEAMIEEFDQNTGLITGFPKNPVHGMLGHLLVPLQHFVVHFHLPVLLSNKTTYTAATAAHGAFMMFRRASYDRIGGHESVKNSLVEDVHISRQVKKSGYRVKLSNITSLVSCDMYHSNREVWEGFAKNMFPGLGRSLSLVIVLSITYSLLYVAPLGLLLLSLSGVLPLVYMLPYVVGVLQKGTVDWATGQKWWLSFLMPFSAILMISLLWYSTYLGMFKKGFSWKGRVYK
ncbi:glycosyltransferase [Alteribacter aurantiacus]|uniref:glycosyltransferase n=1 Tax=Alteribacter aurantiacus TaxID=254410 RepID=UPI0004283E30|nr:glycosyltransferase family 2 protein [Alteribacter aurantiacus]